jgi:hypothetical protein
MLIPGRSEERTQWNPLMQALRHTEGTSACYCTLWRSCHPFLHLKTIALVRSDYFIVCFPEECQTSCGKAIFNGK